jgi:hypothetical protein
MQDAEALQRLRAILTEAKALAGADTATLRVAGERISVIVVDVLYELDFELADVTSLLPAMRREPL